MVHVKNMTDFNVTMANVFTSMTYAMREMIVVITVTSQKQAVLIVVYVFDSFVPLTQSVS